MHITDDKARNRCRQVFQPDYLQPAMLYYRRQDSLSHDLLAMMSAIASTQSTLCADLEQADDAKTRSNLPSAEWLYDSIAGISSAVSDNSPSGESVLAEFAAKCRMLDVLVLVNAAVGGDGPEALEHVAAVTGAPPDVAALILRAAIQPYMAHRHGAGPASPADHPFPLRTTCPACGGLPLMGKHTEPDGHRFIRCSQCGHEWAFPRIGCPGCGETDQGRIESLFVQGDEGHRVYLCHKCKRYFKVSDERLLGVKAYLPLEDIATLHLDEIARQRGYTPVSDGA